jgi:hypothetical protein
LLAQSNRLAARRNLKLFSALGNYPISVLSDFAPKIRLDALLIPLKNQG